jgi:transcriptional regulatory protein AMDR
LRLKDRSTPSRRRRQILEPSSALAPLSPPLHLVDGQAFLQPENRNQVQHSQIQGQQSPYDPVREQQQPILGEQEQQQHIAQPAKHELVLNEKDMVEDNLARTALTDFLHRGFRAPTWSVFQPRDPIRISYVGTPTSNLAYLVGQESPHRGDASLHFLFPSIRPAMPWKPSNDLPLVKWYSTMVQDVSLLPEKEVCDQIIEAFFAKIHPGFPVVDEAEFRSQYADETNPVPLLILQSVLLAGSHVCDHPKVAKSRSLVKVALFRRAKALFDLRYENNREHLVQAALLFTWHFEGADDIGANAYYWIGVACRIAFGLGFHRDSSPKARSVIPVQDRRIQRRLFWVLFQCDVLASLQHGRPLMIDEDECDQPPLAIEDFIEIDGQINHNIHIDYCMQSIKLCYIIISIMK